MIKKTPFKYIVAKNVRKAKAKEYLIKTKYIEAKQTQGKEM